MGDEEKNDMLTAEAMKEVLEKNMPSDRIAHVTKALEEVELIKKGLLPSQSARDFLNELRSKK